MTVEVATYIQDLVATNPTATDPGTEGDNQLRLLKSCLKNSFPNMDFRHISSPQLGDRIFYNAASRWINGTIPHTIVPFAVNLAANVLDGEDTFEMNCFQAPTQNDFGLVSQGAPVGQRVLIGEEIDLMIGMNYNIEIVSPLAGASTSQIFLHLVNDEEETIGITPNHVTNSNLLAGGDILFRTDASAILNPNTHIKLKATRSATLPTMFGLVWFYITGYLYIAHAQ